MMKKISLLLAAAIVAIAAQAQTTTRWGVTAGIGYNELHFKKSDIMKVDRGFGPIVGLTGEMLIPGVGFSVDASLLYAMRTSKLHMGEKTIWSSLGYGNEMCRMHYLDIPLTVRFKYHNLNGVENTIMPMVFAGPTFSIAVGKNLTSALSYKPVSVMLRAGLGCELFNHLQIAAAYNFSVGESANSAKNRCWTLTATYFFK